MAGRPDRIHADPASERLMTSATVVTFVRTLATLALCSWGIVERDLTLLVVGLVVYWVGDSLDGEVARWRDCETRIGAVVDMMCDRLSCALFYIGLVVLKPEMLVPVGIYLFEFMVVDMFLSLAFLAWSIRSPNYFYVVDRRIYLWNWSRLGKAANSGLFAVLLLVTGWWQVGIVIATGLLVLKCVSLKWLLDLGLPVPARPVREEAHGGQAQGSPAP
ncbi:CDP-alcohol phosphatidyltransferase family protein [Nocardioides zeae]|uniref:CDP-alcohol phosphatidyltransferase family protein n=1 Tax=Nocardioides imazamoxiresistens TaxID=3231893 RepID=A0ABU3Q0Y6_9ACTN|nr:CDP-alcohol phosphatidyltransferase family protein [Nocardioides zeae]MDT9595166.1 CDP-alcohol phosphatidyltransferase family protein [Nocardioides zeae]